MRRFNEQRLCKNTGRTVGIELIVSVDKQRFLLLVFFGICALTNEISNWLEHHSDIVRNFLQGICIHAALHLLYSFQCAQRRHGLYSCIYPKNMFLTTFKWVWMRITPEILTSSLWLRWVNFSSLKTELQNDVEIENTVNWSYIRCAICDFCR